MREQPSAKASPFEPAPVQSAAVKSASAEVAPAPLASGEVPAEDLAPAQLPPVELLVCVKCRRETEVPEGGTRPGQALHATLAAKGMPEGVTLKAVECLSNCSSGCSVAVRGGPARWTYVYGNLMEAEHADTVIEGVTAYAATADGLVPWRTRPEHFRKNCIARIPPQEL